jgi:hypothetical protein
MPANPSRPTNRTVGSADPPADHNALAVIINDIYKLAVGTTRTANYTATQSDQGSCSRVDSASSVAVTVPSLEAGTIMQFGRKGAGALTFTASGVTFVPAGPHSARITGSIVTLWWATAAEVWVSGDLT